MIKKNNFKLIIISIMILGVLLLLLLNGCSLFRQYGSLEGYVYVPDTGNKGAIIIKDSNQVPTGYKPLSGAKVSVQDFYNFVFTDINGYFLLEDIVAGPVNILIEPPVNSGYNALTTQAIIEPDTTVPIGTYGAVSLPSEGAGYWDISINQIDDSAYPEVKVYVSVIDPGNDIPMIGAISNNFELEINGNKINTLTAAQAPGETSYPASVSLVIDRSGSMEGENYDDKPLEDAKKAAKTFVNCMGSYDRAEVISFANYVTVDQSFTSDKQALCNAIDSLQSDGATALYDAIWQGLDDTDLEVNSRKAVIALTDGAENCSSNNHGGGDYNFTYSYWSEYPDNSLLINYANSLDIPVYTIGLQGYNFTREKAVRDYSTTEADLKEIAEETGGDYFYAPSSDKLEKIYEEITQRLEQQYIITFEDNTGVTEGYLTVKLNYNQLYGEDTKEYNPLTQEYEGKVEVPLSPYDDYWLSNENWWLYQYEGYFDGFYGEYYHKYNANTNCGPACTAMVINYFKGLDISTTCKDEDFEGYPEVNCEARWNYCEKNLLGGFYCTDWKVPGQMGATRDQIINVLSSEDIETQMFTGYDFLQSEGEGMVEEIKKYIKEGLLCICKVNIKHYIPNQDKDHTHWVVAYGYDNNNIYLNDPGYKYTGQGLGVPIDNFVDALWKFDELSVIITCSY